MEYMLEEIYLKRDLGDTNTKEAQWDKKEKDIKMEDTKDREIPIYD